MGEWQGMSLKKVTFFFPDFEEYGEEEEMPRYVVSLPDEFLKGIGL